MDTGTRLQPEIKAFGCLKITFGAEEIELEREKQFLNYMVSVSRERKRGSGGCGEEKASAPHLLGFASMHGKSACYIKKKKRQEKE